jgi:hypothetical protein
LVAFFVSETAIMDDAHLLDDGGLSRLSSA